MNELTVRDVRTVNLEGPRGRARSQVSVNKGLKDTHHVEPNLSKMSPWSSRGGKEKRKEARQW